MDTITVRVFKTCYKVKRTCESTKHELAGDRANTVTVNFRNCEISLIIFFFY